MSNRYEVEGTFLVRSGTPEQAQDISTEGVGGRRVLKKGEMAWEIGTSNFKIGDGKSEYKDLGYIQPVSEEVRHLYFENRKAFPAVGMEGPLYIDKEKGNIYYFNIDQSEGKQIGYMKLGTSFDILRCEL